MGFCGTEIDTAEFKKYFDLTVSRGPDASKIIETGCGLMGFHRLAIMGLDETGMQPFTLDGDYVVCNGELYGFRATKKELIKKVFYEKRTNVSIAAEEGVTEAAIRNRLKKIYENLRKKI
jgi:asparagine synthase (glutamine-hydrolysing)